jgi:hypothetical protein
MAFAAFVDATDLKQWADRRASQELLPELVRRLVHASAPTATRIEFRSREGVHIGGWDGRVDALSTTVFVPAGQSGWELGVEKPVLGKANSDFDTRVDGGELDPTVSSFRFVTPRRFRDKTKWALAALERSTWADVRAYDADDLATWLDGAPSVHAWISAELGKLPSGVRSLDDLWIAWRNATNPPFSPELVKAGRDAEAVEVASWFAGPPRVNAIGADTVEEALGFVASIVQMLPDDIRTNALARAIVVDDVDAWRQLRRSPGQLVLIPTFLPNDIGAASNHTVLFPVDHSHASRGVLWLPRIRREPAARVLVAMGISREDSTDLATLARRSIPALRRRLASSPVVAAPDWSSAAEARKLLPALLATRWREDIYGDRLTIEALAGKPYREFAVDMAPWFGSPEPPIRRDGSVVLVAAPVETWDLLARYLTPHDVETFRDVAVAMLCNPDPRLDLPRKDRWAAAIHGVARMHSEELREGLAETILQFAVEPNLVGATNGQDLANFIVREVLEAANADATGKMWISVGDVLSLFAESSPREVLDAVDRGLAGSEPLLSVLFPANQDERFGAPTPEHTWITWALELVAWSPDFVGRAAQTLGTLAALDPGGRSSPRPAESLAEILHPLLPQTSANLETRIEILRSLVRSQPDVGFEVLLSLVPMRGGILVPTQTPRRRQWRDGDESTRPPLQEVLSFMEVVVRCLIELAGDDLHRWARIVPLLDDLPEEQRDVAMQALEAVATPDDPDDPGRILLVDQLRQLAAHRRSITELTDSLAGRIDGLVAQFEDARPQARNAWLFTHIPRLPLRSGDDWNEREGEIHRLRLEAIREINAGGRLGALEDLARRCEVPWTVGLTVEEAFPQWDVAERMLTLLIDNESSGRDFAAAWLVGRFISRGWPWIAELEDIEGWTDVRWAELLKALPPDPAVWDAVEAHGESVDRLYWETKNFHVVPKGRTVVRAATKLLEVGRPNVALDLLALLREELSPDDRDLAYQTLEAAAQTPVHAGNPAPQSYDIERLFELIESDPSPDVQRLAGLEWAYLSIYRHGVTQARLLHAELSRDPAFFTSMVTLVFKAEGEPPRELTEDERARGRLAYELLDSWHRPPGLADNDELDGPRLRAWVLAAREQLKAAGRGDIGDQRIGHVLRYTPKGEDGLWPAEPVRALLEELRADDIEIGIATEYRNSRGVTTRGPTDGGAQERDIETTLRTTAAAMSARWPRTASFLSKVADTFSREAQRNDDEAELTEDTWR